MNTYFKRNFFGSLLFITTLTHSVKAQESTGSVTGFEKVGSVSGIEVITEMKPAEQELDLALQTLVNQGTQAFQDQLKKQLDSAGITTTSSKDRLNTAINSPSTLLAVSRYEFSRTFGSALIDEVLKRTQGEQFLVRLLSSQDWLNDLLIAGPISKSHAPQILHGLCSIYRFDKECTLPLYRKLACAHARIITGKWQDDTFHHRLLDRFQAQKRIHKAGRMHGSFDKMESWEMLWVAGTNRMGNSRAIQYMSDLMHYQQGRYFGACWSIPYRLKNTFGDSIHTRYYYMPWQNGYQGEPLRHKVGGVCGTLSNFGAGLARTHGIPSFPAGQPGHCAYMVRHNSENWGTAYSVTGNTGVGTFFGAGDESMIRLLQEAYSNKTRPQLLAASHLDWIANYLQDRSPSLSAGERNARKLSIQSQPLHVNHWQHFINRLSSQSKPLTTSQWLALSRGAINSFGRYQGPCLNFLNRSILPHLDKLPPKDRFKIITQWHTSLPKKEPAVHYVSNRHLNGFLNSQVDKFKTDPILKTRFVNELLQQYTGTKRFSTVLSWTRSTLSKEKEGASLFLKIVSQYIKNNKDQASSFIDVLGQVVIDTEKNLDAETLASTSKLAAQLFQGDAEYKKIYHHTKKGMESIKAKLKGAAKFQGKLLSKNAIPIVAHPYDKKTCLSHWAALQPQQLGFIITKKSKNPRIDLQLPGKCKLSGLTIVPRVDHDPQRSFPMKVSVSIDGKKWQHIGTFEKPQDLLQMNLAKQSPEASWLRFERDNENYNYLEIRAIRVYGSSQY